MKVLLAAAVVAGTTFAFTGSSVAMPLAPQDSPSLVQTVKDPTCNAPARNARCKWYGMPGVHKGPKWLRQSSPGRHHVHHPKKKHVMHKAAAPKPTGSQPVTPAPTPQTTTPPATTPPAQQPQQ